MMTPQQREQWERDGYIIVENALNPFGLDQVRAAYEAVEADQLAEWHETVAAGTMRRAYGNGPDAHTMFNIFDYDPLFLDIAENPVTMPLIQEVIGPNFQVMDMFCHKHHAGTNAHTDWHRDWPAYAHPSFVLKAKIFYFLDDQDEDMGCFSLVPGSHKFPDNPEKGKYANERLEDMPGCKKMIGPAGSAIIWNVVCWHTALANKSPRDRRILIYGYMPFWVKKWENRTIPNSILEWANTPIRRQMMGIHAVHGRNVWDRTDVERLSEQDEAFQNGIR